MTDCTTTEPIPSQRRLGWPFATGLLALMIAGDQLIWAVLPGIALPLFVLGVALTAHILSRTDVTPRTGIVAWFILLVALIPSVDLVQPLSVAFAFGGLLAFIGIMIGETGRAASLAALRFPFYAPSQIAQDTALIARQSRGSIGGSLRDWIVPGGLGLIFLALLMLANPVLDQWATTLVNGTYLSGFSVVRVLFWAGLAALIWPFLRLTAMRARLIKQGPTAKTFGAVWFLSHRSVARALVVFNLIFATQTATDIAILWGGADLPEGMTYATYAQQGAYPLVFAALLAGGFALLTQPFLIGRPALKILLLIWVTQTALLVASSMLRLDLYIETYSLTRLRFAAYVWMGVVAGGLILMIWQILRGFGPGWLILRAAELGVIALYLCSLINVDGLVARHNLADHLQAMDAYYVCRLGEGAVPAITAFDARHGGTLCAKSGGTPALTVPRDWREWGYRNARLRTTLTKIEGATQ